MPPLSLLRLENNLRPHLNLTNKNGAEDPRPLGIGVDALEYSPCNALSSVLLAEAKEIEEAWVVRSFEPEVYEYA
jgi:hypothetical protein